MSGVKFDALYDADAGIDAEIETGEFDKTDDFSLVYENIKKRLEDEAEPEMEMVHDEIYEYVGSSGSTSTLFVLTLILADL